RGRAAGRRLGQQGHRTSTHGPRPNPPYLPSPEGGGMARRSRTLDQTLRYARRARTHSHTRMSRSGSRRSTSQGTKKKDKETSRELSTTHTMATRSSTGPITIKEEAAVAKVRITARTSQHSHSQRRVAFPRRSTSKRGARSAVPWKP